MNFDQMDFERKVALTSAIIYATISVSAGVLFLLAATYMGTYSAVARLGGTVWVMLLSFIVTMPLVISTVKKRMKA